MGELHSKLPSLLPDCDCVKLAKFILPERPLFLPVCRFPVPRRSASRPALSASPGAICPPVRPLPPPARPLALCERSAPSLALAVGSVEEQRVQRPKISREEN
jgi:hypothetical protein